MQVIKYQHKLQDKDWRPVQKTPAFTLHQTPTILVIFRIVHEYCRCQALTSNRDSATLRNTHINPNIPKMRARREGLGETSSFCNKTDAKSNKTLWNVDPRDTESFSCPSLL